MKSTPANATGYTVTQISLHWLIAALVLFQLLFGFAPFEGHSDYEVMRRIVNGERAELPAEAALLPPRALALLLSLLARDAQDRPASAVEALQEFEALLMPSDAVEQLGALVARARKDHRLSHGNVPTRCVEGALEVSHMWTSA